ncbi:ABC transporter substrate-binding protein [Massilia sp. W12]|uniref:ABC transporter substrate-binding protein n=1 Tax=Massilia sp. W12 TaxID=3126507 RepID=UPI0030D4520A
MGFPSSPPAMIRAFCFSLLLCCLPAQAQGVLRVFLTGPEVSLDPASATDLASLSILENLYDAPLAWAYLARPLELQAQTLSALPQISADGKTWLLDVRPGQMFDPDPAFGGKARELTAEDYAYSWKRLYDPALKSAWLFMLEGKLEGDEVLREAARAGRFDAKQNISGLQVLSRYRLQVRLRAPDPEFRYFLTLPAAAAVAHETVGKNSWPRGVGPYRLAEWKPSHRLLLRANPDYRRQLAPAQQVPAAWRDLQRSLQQQTLPRNQAVDIRIVEEGQARLLGFANREFDLLEQVPPDLAGSVAQLEGTSWRLRPEWQKRGIKLSTFVPMQVYFLWFNLRDPVIGGYSPEKIALRRAIALGHDQAQDLRILEHGLGQPAASPLPPGVPGHDPQWRGSLRYDPKLANALLDRFGYKRGADGWRTLPNGQPLELRMHTLGTSKARAQSENWQKEFQALGLRLRFIIDKPGEIRKAARAGQVQMAENNWIGDYPDAANFLQLLAGDSSGNYTGFKLAAYDAAYAGLQRSSEPARRAALLREMEWLVQAYNPWVLRMYPLSLDLLQPDLQNYVRHPVHFTNWRYLQPGR